MLVIFFASGPTNATSRGKWARSSASRGEGQFHQAHYNHYMAISNGYQKEALLRCSKLIRILGLPSCCESQFNQPQAPATTWLNDECHWSPQSPPLVPGSCVVGWQRWRWSGAARNWRSRGVWTRRRADRTGKTGGINPAIHGINMEIPW